MIFITHSLKSLLEHSVAQSTKCRFSPKKWIPQRTLDKVGQKNSLYQNQFANQPLLQKDLIGAFAEMYEHLLEYVSPFYIFTSLLLAVKHCASKMKSC